MLGARKAKSAANWSKPISALALRTFRSIKRSLVLITWVCALAATGSPALAGGRGEDKFMSNVRQLTFEGRRTGECYFSANSKKLLFMSEREPGNPFFQIYLLNFETGDVSLVSPGKGKATCPYFQVDTGFIVYASTHLDSNIEAKAKTEYEHRQEGQRRRGSWDYDEYYDLFVAREDGTIIKQLTDAYGYDAESAYSPDGSKIVFCSTRDAHSLDELSVELRRQYEKDPAYFGEIYIMNADGTNQTRLTDWPGYDGGPFFSPDGERILWRHFTEDGFLADIYTMKIDGTDRRRLTDMKCMSWAPYFHFSGEYCIFTSNKFGFSNFELFIVDALGEREPLRVTYTERFDGLPAFSPDNKWLCWTSNNTDTGLSQIFIADWDHQAALRALANSPLRKPGSASGP